VTREQEEALCSYLHTHTGIVIHEHQRGNLRDTLQRAVARFGYAQAGDYIQRLHECTPDSEELEYLMANVTVGESYFFRDKNQMEFLRTGWLPQLMARKNGQHRSIRIWSAGCSHGQEIYSMAIMLHAALPDAARWNLQLHATDINAEALSAAVAARYSAWSFRATPEAVCGHYFKRMGDEYQLQEELRSLVHFCYLNLVEDEFPMIARGLYSMDLILCRNVFIYFDAATVAAVMKKFARCLAPGGLLVLGGADPVNTGIEGLELQQAGGVFYYRRTGAGRVAVAAAPEHVSPDNIIGTDEVADPAPRAEAPQDDAMAEKANTIETIARLVAQQCWAGALEAADRYIATHGENATVLLHKAGALASLGRLEEAGQLSQQVTRLEPMEKYAHFLNALVLIERNELGAAENGMRKSLYIDSRFLEAHYQLGLLQLRQGRHEQGVKSLMNALEIAETGDPEHAVHGAPEMTYRRMTEVLHREIQVYSHPETERSR
jgi:chemotaxis protein methyltransferase CheR